MDEAIAKFSEFTGLSHDESSHHISAFEGDFESAIQSYFNNDTASILDSSALLQNEDIPGISNLRPIRQQTDMMMETTAAASTLNNSPPVNNHISESWLSRLVSVTSSGIHIFAHYFNRLADIIGNVLFSSSEKDVVDFTQFYQGKFGPNHPRFFAGGFNEALSFAIKKSKLVAIYMHMDADNDQISFQTNILENADIQNLLNEKFVFFGQKLSYFQRHRQFAAIRAICYPAIVILAPRNNNNAFIKLGIVEGNSTTSNALSLLRNSLLYDFSSSTTDAQRREVETFRKIREEQDQEFQESIRRDAAKREMTLKKQREQEIEQKKLEERRVLLEEEQMAKKKILEELKENRNKLAVTLKEIDGRIKYEELNRDQKAKISLRLPSGAKLEKFFLPDHTIEDLVNWVEASEALYATRTDISIPPRYNLTVPQLKLRLQASKATLREVGLYPSAAIFLTVQSDDTEDGN